MKKVILAIGILAIVSCKKELETEVKNETTTAAISAQDNSNLLNRKTKFGALIGGGFDNDKSIEVAKNLNAAYVREALIMDDWNGKFLPYEAHINAGIGVILNVNDSRYDALYVPFPKKLTDYRKTLTEITNTYQPEVIVIENEEINKTYHSGPMADYIEMLKVALDVCHAKGIKVTNGGIYGPSLEVATYRYLQTKGQQRADSFANNCMETYQVKAAQTVNSNANIERDVRKLDTLLNFYNNLDYVNVHLYEPMDPDVSNVLSKASNANTVTPVVIADIQEFIRVRTGREAMSNEVGQRNNTNPDLVTTVLKEFDRLKFPYVLWFSGDGNAGAKPLHDLKTGVLQPNGIAFSDFLETY